MVEERKEFVGNISLPPKLQSPETRDDSKLKVENFPMIINLQRAAYENIIANLGNQIDR